MLGKVDKWAGLVVGIGKWAFYISTCIWFADLLNVKLPDSYIAHTILWPVIKVFSPAFVSWVSNWLPILKKWLEALKSL